MEKVEFIYDTDRNLFRHSSGYVIDGDWLMLSADNYVMDSVFHNTGAEIDEDTVASMRAIVEQFQ